jgi:AbrB family looped-hinge helix DNA binding protein
MEQLTCKVDSVGRIMIPAGWRKRHGIGAGSEVILMDEGGRLTLETRKQALKRVQRWARTLPGAGRPVVDEFLAERRAEARREAREG